jgi:hypothetical protein
MTTVAIPRARVGSGHTGHGHGMGYQYARLYLLGLCRGEARLNLQRALEATGICEAHKHGRIDSSTVFPPAPGAGADQALQAEAWMRAIGTAA